MVIREVGTRVYTVPAVGDKLGKTRMEIEEEMQREHNARLLAVIGPEGIKPDDEAHGVAEGDFLLVIAEEAPPGAILR
jgi:hypothetical protein